MRNLTESNTIKLVTDGSCLGNPGPGGWAYLCIKDKNSIPDDTQVVSGAHPSTTNNRMEMTAVIKALESHLDSESVQIITDSRYVIDAFEKKWIDGWIKRGWKTASGSPTKNIDLWKRLLELVDGRSVEWVWVKGHSGHAWNELVDTAARSAASNVK